MPVLRSTTRPKQYLPAVELRSEFAHNIVKFKFKDAVVESRCTSRARNPIRTDSPVTLPREPAPRWAPFVATAFLRGPSGEPVCTTVELLSAPALSKPFSWPAVGATAPASGPSAVLPILLRVGPPGPSNIASRSDFRLCRPTRAYILLTDRALNLLCLYHRVGEGVWGVLAPYWHKTQYHNTRS